MTNKYGRSWSWCVVALALGTLGLAPETPAERAVDVLMNLAERRPDPIGVRVQPVSVGSQGQVRARLYVGSASLRRGIVLLHGVHAAGIEEPRIVRFATHLAAVGMAVLTPALSDLSDYRVTGESLSVIEQSVHYLAGREDLVAAGRVGLVGFSFAGGLALVSASNAGVSDHLEHVMSVGGHHDLERVLRFFLTNRIATPGGTCDLAAHEYGPVVLLYGALGQLSPPVDRPVLERAIRAWLREARSEARSEARRLKTAKGKRLFDAVEHGRISGLASELSAWIAARRSHLGRVSPSGQLEAIPVPVYLLHGVGDRVIPPSETQFADAELGAHAHRTLITGAIEHVAPEGRGGLFEQLALVDFLSLLL